MNENTQIKIFVITLFIISVMGLSQIAHAALALTPMVSGYSSGSGTFSAAAGSFSTASNAASYGSTGVVSVGGKSITVPASNRMAANAGQIAKNAMKITPWGIVGTLAAGYLLDQGLQYIDGQGWMKPKQEVLPGETACHENIGYQDHCGSAYWSTHIGRSFAPGTPLPSGCSQNHIEPTAPKDIHAQCTAPAPSPLSPYPDADWDGLPDPLPVVAPELPYAPYMPQGAPVESPDYDFAPFSAPIGEPYTKPDNSTAQPMAKVSPNGKGVTVDTYDQPLTSPDGMPTPDAPPLDTAEPVPEQKTQCDKFPASLGCANLDIPNAENMPSEVRNIALIAPVSIGGAGSCPIPLTASFLGQTVEMSFDPLCQFANSLRPVVLVLAWLAAGVIFIGGVRNG